MVTAAVTRLQPEQALEAVGYIRVSRKVQAEGHSPEIQREAIKRLARQEGYLLTDDMIEEDHERGSKLTRKGYQPVDDLGFRAAVKRHYGLAKLPGSDELRALGARWAPYRTVATWYLWRSLGNTPRGG